MQYSENMLVNAIVVERRHEPHTEAIIVGIIASVKAGGSIDPILVQRREGGRPYLIEGRHRLEAFRRLKRATIPTIKVGGYDHAAALRELKEAERVTKFVDDDDDDPAIPVTKIRGRGRPPIGAVAMTSAERVRRHRLKAETLS